MMMLDGKKQLINTFTDVRIYEYIKFLNDDQNHMIEVLSFSRNKKEKRLNQIVSYVRKAYTYYDRS
jgi:hypothetical protein